MSKGLELFQELRKSLNEELNVSSVANDKLDNIEKELKALEILKNKDLNVGLLKISEDLEDYKFMCDCDSEKDLTQEEYNLLKEVLL